MDVKVVVSVILVAFGLLMGVMIFGNIHSRTRVLEVWEQPSVNDTLALVNNTWVAVTNTPINTDETVTVTNTSLTVNTGNYSTNTTHIRLLAVGENYDDGNYDVSYTYYGGDAYDQLEATADQTYSGYQLGSLIPYILFAVAIIVVLLKAFAI